jgi:predicted nucleotidyltransferase
MRHRAIWVSALWRSPVHAHVRGDRHDDARSGEGLISASTCQYPPDERDEILATLRAHEPELRASGIVRLSLFGSTARNQARADSDIDLLAAFDDRPLSLLDVIGIENRIADLLGRPVDLIEEGALRARARQSANREAVRAF